MRLLIVNADDFGLTPGINRAIIEAHTRGIVTSATLMANMPAFDEAVQLAKAHPTLGVGLHFNLTQGRPVAPPDKVCSLLNEQGEFLGTSTQLWQRALTRRLQRKEIVLEFRAQVEKVLKAGLQLTHVDSHKHAHAIALVFAAINATLGLYDIRALRLPREPVRWSQACHSLKLLKQALTASALSYLCRDFQRQLDATATRTTTTFFGITQTGCWSKRWLLDLLDRLPAGTSELMCHPGYDDAALRQIATRLRASRAAELELLLDAELPVLLRSRGIELVSYAALAGAGE